MRSTLNKPFVLVIGSLVLLSTFFTVEVERFRQRVASVRLEGEIESGTLVSVVKAVDGDELSVQREDGERFVVRILGVKSFETSADAPGSFGQAAKSRLSDLVDLPVTLEFETFKKDRRGRVLAYVSRDGRDVGLDLVKRGLSLVFEAYPFAREEAYKAVQRKARADKSGLWSNAGVVQRSEALIASWKASRHD